MYIYIFVSWPTWEGVCVCERMFAHLCVCVSIIIRVCTHACIYIVIYIYIDIHICINTYSPIYTYTYIHIHVYIYMYILYIYVFVLKTTSPIKWRIQKNSAAAVAGVCACDYMCIFAHIHMWILMYKNIYSYTRVCVSVCVHTQICLF